MLPCNSVLLRAVESRDLSHLGAIYGDLRALGAWLPSEPRPTNAEQILARFDASNVAGATESATELEFTITCPEVSGDLAIGIGGLYGIDRHNGRAELGTAIVDPAARKHGCGLDSLLALALYALRTLRLNRVDGSVKGSNDRALATLGRIGMVPEGTLREARWENGEYVDLHLFGLLRSGWRDELLDWRRPGGELREAIAA